MVNRLIFSYVSVMQQEDNVETTTITPVTDDTTKRNGVAVENELESETSALAVGGAQPLINGNTETLLECSDENEYLNKELDPLEDSKNASDITKHSSKISNSGKKPPSSAVKVRQWCDVVNNYVNNNALILAALSNPSSIVQQCSKDDTPCSTNNAIGLATVSILPVPRDPPTKTVRHGHPY